MKRLIVALLVGGALMVTVAFAAGLTVTPSSLGSGSGAVASCGSVDNVTYTLDTGDPTLVDAVNIEVTTVDCVDAVASIMLDDEDPDTNNTYLATTSCTVASDGGADSGPGCTGNDTDLNVSAAALEGVGVTLVGP